MNLAALALSAAVAGHGAAPSADLNGVWVSAEGFVFEVMNPFTIWTTLNHRHFSAFQLADSGSSAFSAKYESSREMKAGYGPSAQVTAQYTLLNDPASKFPVEKLEVPLEIPHASVSDPVKADETGRLTADHVTAASMHMNWTNQAGQVDFSGSVTKLGGPEFIQLGGAFQDRELKLDLSETGEGAKRLISGSATIGKAKYRLQGLTVWGRGSVVLYPETGDNVVGGGWIEWDPSASLAIAMRNSKPQPTDSILAYIQTSRVGFIAGATHRLSRIESN